MTSNPKNTTDAQIISQSGLGKLVKIIDRLAGDKPNLKISFQELKFNIDKTKVCLNGEINFNIVHRENTKK